MSFAQYLKQKISSEGISRIKLIDDLVLFNDDFSQLDPVTLSRWFNNKTTPSIYKQLIICHYFKDNILNYILDNIDTSMSNNLIRTKRNVYQTIAPKYNNNPYITSKKEDTRTYIEKYSYDDSFRIFKNFYKNFKSYDDALKIRKKYLDINAKRVLISRRSLNGEFRSHMAITYHHDTEFLLALWNTLINTTIDIPTDKIISSELSNFHDQTSLKEILFHLSLYFIANNLVDYTLVFAARGEKIRDFAISLGAQPLAPKIKDSEELYPMQVEVLKLISSPLTINTIKEYYNPERKMESFKYTHLEKYPA
ncbi:TPA: hypothetical protein ACX6QC_002695 [Photobacterium damselae]